MTNYKFDYVSLFRGIGGFDVALDKLGGRGVMSSEIDKFATQAAQAFLPNDRNVGDITKVQEYIIPYHNALVAGFPCPTFSVAGGRKGMDHKCTECGHVHLVTYQEYRDGATCPECGADSEPEDDRGMMFFESCRVAEAKQPEVFVLENVKGLISSGKGEVLKLMIETLNFIGYTVDYDELNSKYFGVPHNRERIFIIAIRDDLVEVEEWKIPMKKNTLQKRKKGYKDTIEDLKSFNFDWPEQKGVTTKLRDVLEENPDSKYYLSEDKTKALIAKLENKDYDEVRATLTPDRLEKRQNGRRFKDNDEPSFTLTSQDKHGVTISEGLPIREATTKGYAIAKEGDAVNIKFANSKTRRGRVGKQIAQTLEATGINQGVVEQFSQGEGISYCVDANYRKGISESSVGKGRRTHILESDKPMLAGSLEHYGNDQMNRVYDPEGVSPTLTVPSGGGREQKIVEKSPNYRIRKLTPLETWRLQGFEDWQFLAAKKAGVSDSQLYKQSGNAVTVNVIVALFSKIIESGFLGEA